VSIRQAADLCATVRVDFTLKRVFENKNMRADLTRLSQKPHSF
jgi:hypothetical protein